MKNVEVIGIAKANAYLLGSNLAIKNAIKAGINEATLFVEGEVKQSVSGRKAEPKSVDTGRFLQSITSDIKNDSGIIYSDVEYAKYLEYGTSRINARKHFGNTVARNKTKVEKFINDKIKNATKL